MQFNQTAFVDPYLAFCWLWEFHRVILETRTENFETMVVDLVQKNESNLNWKNKEEYTSKEEATVSWDSRRV